LGFTDDLFDRGNFRNYFALVKQFAFAGVRAMADMYFTRRAVFAQRHLLSLVMRPSFGAALLGMSSFRIWHIISNFKIINFVSIRPGPILFT
jgi:hypothetical protein